MPKIAALGGMSSRGFGEFAQQTSANYIEDVFSTWLYTGTGASQTITNGIDLAGKGGLVWIKQRTGTASHYLQDTSRGITYTLSSDTTSAQAGPFTGTVTSANSNGFSLGTSSLLNGSGTTYASWTFRKQPKFFDVVTYTGNGSANRQINHNLGSVPGMIIVKCTSTALTNWPVYHRGLNNGVNPQNFAIYLNLTNDGTGGGRWAGTAPTATQFSVNNDNSVNTNGDTYVAYLFAHNAGGFGADGSQNVISCGSYVGTGTAGVNITLGWEPQFLLVKNTSSAADWRTIDIMRAFTGNSGGDLLLSSNSSAADTPATRCRPTATGFEITANNAADFNTSGSTFIYMAIRRGPMRTPTSGTSVFNPQIATTDYTTTTPLTGMNPGTDVWWNARRTPGSGFYDLDRLRGWRYLQPPLTNAENTTITWSQQTQTSLLPSASWWGGSTSQISYFFNRAPGFMDVVCYTGTGSPITVSHNLGVVPELMIVKNRSGGFSWVVYSAALNATKILIFNTDSAQITDSTVWNNTGPTATQFTVGTSNSSNASGSTYVAYLFATCPGVSKVGSYTGTGATQTISCGFTGGARYVLIKRTDSTGSWWVWDTARGMVAGTDPRLAYNSTAAETNANWVYTTTGGFQIVTSDATVNASGGTYIYLAIS